MLIKEEEKNIITGLLGTVAVHLLVLIIFLVARLNKVRDVYQEPIVIEFDQDMYKTLEQLAQQQKTTPADIKSLSNEEVKNIAVNTAEQVEKNISTEKYIEQLKEELDIKDLNQQHDRSLGDISVASDKKEQQQTKKENQSYTGPTRIEYNLKGRTKRYINVPVYKCEGGGKVIVNIIVNQEGEVISATLASSNTQETCIIETALQSASISLFNIDTDADPRQKGTISYEFVAQ